MKKLSLISIALSSIFLLSGCGSSDSASELSKEELGEMLFSDKNLSLTRNTSCTTCHNPEHAFVDARFSEDGVDQNIFIHGALSVGDDGVSLGGRNAPTASYAQFNPEFHKQDDGSYKGGQFHDGRAATLKIQAMGPPLDGAEMQMSDKSAVVDRLKENEVYVKAFENLYGSDIFDDIDASYEAMAEAIAKFEKTELFAPFDSKYDRYKQCRDEGKRTNECFERDAWTLEEQAGYSLFFSQANTSCATCHTINSSSEAIKNELFTNFEYENIGTPRNIEAMDARTALGLQDANATFRGLGATVENTDANYSAHLGKVKVPTLRNVAVTAPYMSNGVFKKLRTVLEFYDHMGESNNNLHPINPETGEVWGSNDFNSTINHSSLAQKSMNDVKIRNLEAFLRTLTDKRYEHLLPELAPAGELGN
jgi:cytochrome c peroxidase